MTQHFRSAHNVLVSVKGLLAAGGPAQRRDLLDQVIGAIHQGRGYSWTGIYLEIGGRMLVHCSRGPAPEGDRLNADSGNSQSAAQTVVPIRIAAHTLGAIAAGWGHIGARGSQERALLRQIARLLAGYLAGSAGLLLARKAREQSAQRPAQGEPQKGPQPARPVAKRAAAGEYFIR